MSEITATPSAVEVRPAPTFTQGNIMRHVVVMAATGGIGLMALFVVDLLSLLYVSWLGSATKIAGVGFAATILFFAMSINIGCMIAISALVSKKIGSGDKVGARRMAGSGVAWMVVISVISALVLLTFKDTMLTWLNARGDAAAIASRFLDFTLPSNILMALGVSYSAVLRAAGEARRAMYVTLGGGIATAFIDPMLIFGLHLDVMGAAYSTIIARLIFFVIGYAGAVVKLDLVAFPTWQGFLEDGKPLAAIALPSVLTNLATPVGSAFLARVIAHYGDSAVAAGAVIDRVTPLAFGGLFALSGAVGPVLGQNWGAGLFGRMQRTLTDSYVVATAYVITAWLLLIVARNAIVILFQLDASAADIVRTYCLWSGVGWIGLGALFVANASFNNLGAPLRATLFNWGRATLGTIPFATYGASMYGPKGAIFGVLGAGLIFGGWASVSAYLVLQRIAKAGLQRQSAHAA